MLRDVFDVANELMLFSAMFALGLEQSFQGLRDLWGQPILLLRSLLAIYVLVPLVAFVVAGTLPGLPPAAVAGILFMAAAGSAPFVARKAVSRVRTSASYTVSLEITVAGLAIVTVPITLLLLPGDWRISPVEVAWQVFRTQLVGLGLGLLVHQLRPALAGRLVRPFSLIATLLLALVALVALVLILPHLLPHLTGIAVSALVVTIAVSIAVGHLLGGPRPDTRTALGLLAATRNLGLALVIAGANLEEPLRLPALGMILTYTLVAQVLHVPYLAWCKRAARRQTERPRSAPA